MNTLKAILCSSIVCMLMVCSGVTADVHVEYERSGPCDVSNIFSFDLCMDEGHM